VAPNQDTLLIPRDRNGFGLPDTYLPGAAAVIPHAQLPDGVAASPLLWTTAEAGCAKEVAVGQDPVVGACAERNGPYAVGALIRTVSETDPQETSGTRIAVVGDSDFASNRHFHNSANADLFLTAVNWLAEGKEVISIDRKVLDVRRLVLSPERVRFLQISSAGLLPLLPLLAGGLVWWRRRK
jgi:hypothetical protein